MFMGFPRQGYWSGCLFFLQGIFPTLASSPCLLHWQKDSLPLSQVGNRLAQAKEERYYAFNLFCSDLRSQAHLHKYVVVYFREGDITDSYRALSVCPTYRLTKDATGFCAELLRAKQRVSVGRRSRACRYSCCSL